MGKTYARQASRRETGFSPQTGTNTRPNWLVMIIASYRWVVGSRWWLVHKCDRTLRSRFLWEHVQSRPEDVQRESASRFINLRINFKCEAANHASYIDAPKSVFTMRSLSFESLGQRLNICWHFSGSARATLIRHLLRITVRIEAKTG